MTSEAIANAIRSRFKSQVADVLELPTQYDNQKFDKPDNANWCRFTIEFGERFAASFGSPGANRRRTVGAAFAQLFAPIENGDGELFEIADYIASKFDAVNADGVVFKITSAKKIGRSGDSWQINVVCPFYADDIG